MTSEAVIMPDISAIDEIKELLTDAPAPKTMKAYEGDMKYFWAWSVIVYGDEGKEKYPVHPDVLECFMADHIRGLDDKTDAALVSAGVKKQPGPLKIDTIKRRVSGVIRINQMLGHPNIYRTPNIKAMARAAKRRETHAGVVKKQARAITAATLDKIIGTYGTRKSLKDKRDIAMMVFSFYTGGRRNSEVIDARMQFLTRFKGGYEYLLSRSKTDQAGRGFKKLLRNPHAKHLTSWLDASGVDDGHIFRSIGKGGNVKETPPGNNTLSLAIKERMAALGHDPAFYSAHSLRRGFMTQCGMSGVPLSDAMQCSGHKNPAVALQYYEEGSMESNSGTRLNQKRPKK